MTTFKTSDNLYKWLVMPLVLTNSPINLMRLMNEVIKEFISKLLIVYLMISLCTMRLRKKISNF